MINLACRMSPMIYKSKNLFKKKRERAKQDDRDDETGYLTEKCNASVMQILMPFTQ